jgi:hypothetical protein
MNRKSALLATCGAAALALAIGALPATVAAQGIQATPMVQGTVVIDSSVPGQDTITVDGYDAIIDWFPIDNGSGGALTFLPDGNTAIFQSLPSAPGFAVINRILPAANPSPAIIAGDVVSQLMGPSGPVGPGGNVLFYSSAGFIIGSTATFDVGRLVLTTLAPDAASYEQFALGNDSLLLTGVSGDTSSILIELNAQIDATAEGSYLVVASPEITNFGTSFINGSTVFVAAQEVVLTHSSGLFDIVMPVGSISSQPISHFGDAGGPSSGGIGDNHVIYGVAQGQTDPFTTLFSGNLGFDPAVSAGIENGVVVLSANYSVSGTSAVNDFTSGSLTSLSTGEIIVEGSTVTSSLDVQSSHFAQVSSTDATTSIDGNLYVYARDTAQITATSGGTVDITGNAVVSSNVVGNSIPNPNNPSDLDGEAGTSLITVSDGGAVLIDGDASVFAVGTMGLDSAGLVAGEATGGVAEVSAINGSMTFGGNLLINASALPTSSILAYNSGGGASGLLAQLLAEGTGSITVAGDVTMLAQGSAFDLTGPGDANPVGLADGGFILLQASDGTLIDIDGSVSMDASAFGSNTGGALGGAATGGQSDVILFSAGEIIIGGGLEAFSNATGGTASGGTGGTATAGTMRLIATGSSTLDVTTGGFAMTSEAIGGDGQTGGDAAAGTVTVELAVSTVNSSGMNLLSSATGGNGTTGPGGSGLGNTVDIIVPTVSLLVLSGALSAASEGTGGNSADGAGGDGTGGEVDVNVTGGGLSAVGQDLSFRSTGKGGDGSTGGLGSAVGLGFLVSDEGVVQSRDLTALVETIGGTGSTGAGGQAIGASLFAGMELTSSLTSSGAISFVSDAVGGGSIEGNGGNATAGAVEFSVDLSELTANAGSFWCRAPPPAVMLRVPETAPAMRLAVPPP